MLLQLPHDYLLQSLVHSNPTVRLLSLHAVAQFLQHRAKSGGSISELVSGKDTGYNMAITANTLTPILRVATNDNVYGNRVMAIQTLREIINIDPNQAVYIQNMLKTTSDNPSEDVNTRFLATVARIYLGEKGNKELIKEIETIMSLSDDPSVLYESSQALINSDMSKNSLMKLYELVLAPYESIAMSAIEGVKKVSIRAAHPEKIVISEEHKVYSAVSKSELKGELSPGDGHLAIKILRACSLRHPNLQVKAYATQAYHDTIAEIKSQLEEFKSQNEQRGWTLSTEGHYIPPTTGEPVSTDDGNGGDDASGSADPASNADEASLQVEGDGGEQTSELIKLQRQLHEKQRALHQAALTQQRQARGQNRRARRASRGTTPNPHLDPRFNPANVQVIDTHEPTNIRAMLAAAANAAKSRVINQSGKSAIHPATAMAA